MTDPVIEQQVIERMGQMYYEFSVALKELNDIRSGRAVVIPADIEHAKAMVRMGQFYINECHQETLNALTTEY